jgi:hypothetical protein
MLKLQHIRIYASSGTLPGRGGPFGAADQKTWNGQHLLAAFFSIPLWQRGMLTSPPFGRWPERASGPEGKGRQGGIFKALKYYEFVNLFMDCWILFEKGDFSMVWRG